jgi:hypothetical protein
MFSSRRKINGMTEADTALIVLAYMKVLAWPVTTLVVVGVFREPIRVLISKLQHVKLPGGAELNWQQAILDAEHAAEKVGSLADSATVEQPAVVVAASEAREPGLFRSPTNFEWSLYRNFVRRDPKLALEGLRTELSLMLKNLAKLYNIKLPDRKESIDQLLIHLADARVLSNDEVQLVRSINDVIQAARCDAAITQSDANRTLDSAEVFKNAYLSLLSQNRD